MAARICLGFITLLFFFNFCFAIYEDQVGLTDWQQKYIGKVKHAVFHTQKTGRKRVIVSTEENIIASLDLRRGDIFWRHVLAKNDHIDQVDLALGKYVISLSSEGSILRAWNLPDGLLIWESVLQVPTQSKSLLYIPTHSGMEKEGLILVSGAGRLHAVSSVDGVVVWSTQFSSESLEIQQIFEADDGEVIYAAGFLGSSQFGTYHINKKNGEILKQISGSYAKGFSGETSFISNDMLVALDAARSTIISIKLQDDAVNMHETHISHLVQDFSGKAQLLPSKYAGLFALKANHFTLLVRVNSLSDLTLVDKFRQPASISDAVSLSGEQAFAIAQHSESNIHLRVKLDNDVTNDVLKEAISIDRERGHIQKVFINNYLRTDKSHGFRALFVMEDYSLLLVQQGEIVWSREDGLASIVDSTTSELPVEKNGVSVAKVEHSLFEWLKSHLLKLKSTLMLATPDDLAAIQGMRAKNSQKNKLTRDHNGFRKLIIVLTKAGKVHALHTGDGRVVWSHFITSLRKSDSCQSPSALNLYKWQIPHHHALDQNPSILVVGKCGSESDTVGILSIIDSYTGKEIGSQMLSHSVLQVIPLPYTDSAEQILHMIIDANFHAHLYPRNLDSLTKFNMEKSNLFWYSVETARGVIRGHAYKNQCTLDVSDEYCFDTKELWSIVLPSESEKIATVTTRKLNEIVHTQAKVVADQDVMYKYISKNILFVATVSTKASGEIGSATPEEAWLIAYLIDTVSGRILHRVTHQGAQGPIHAVMSENWVVYHYFNLRAHRFEMSVIEIYDQSRADNKDVLKLVLGKHNLTSPVSSYSRPEVVIKSQSYFFTHSVKAMAVTSTAKGITSKQILVGTISDQVLALDKRLLDPRRSANPTAAEKEEGIIPLTDSLPIVSQSYITHSYQIESLRGIMTFPARLESAAHVFTYGVDLFYTRIAPSRTYDSLTEDFSYALLLITIVALLAAIFITWILSEKKELKEKWR